MTKYSFIGNLIRAGGDAKTSKGNGKGYITGILYMLSAKQSGVNLCANAGIAGCSEACLIKAGRGAMNSVFKGRQRKTDWFNTDRSGFMAQLVTDLEKFVTYCAKRNLLPAQRLNGTTDIRWELIPVTRNGVKYGSIFEAFTEVQFYDYTKIANRRVGHLPNYHLTFSYSAASPAYLRQCEIALSRGMNIAVVWRDADKIPQSFLGRDVIDGDKTDMRFTDPNGVIVGLYAKGKQAKLDQSGFVQD